MRIPAPAPLACAVLLLALLGPAHAQKPYAANGVGLGGSEADVKKRYPSAHCKPLEWKTDAADRRCDDARVMVSGVESRITYYLKSGAIIAFDVRLDYKDVPKLIAGLKGDWGPPKAETKEILARKGKEDREIYKVLWEAGRDRAVLTAVQDKKRVQLEVSRGSFSEEVYRVR